jgi:hypothetical protein
VRANAQSGDFQADILVKNLEIPMMFVTSRCNNAGPLGKPIPTRSFVASLLARLAVSRLRW